MRPLTVGAVAGDLVIADRAGVGGNLDLARGEVAFDLTLDPVLGRRGGETADLGGRRRLRAG
jgi:hypothetical protein